MSTHRETDYVHASADNPDDGIPENNDDCYQCPEMNVNIENEDIVLNPEKVLCENQVTGGRHGEKFGDSLNNTEYKCLEEGQTKSFLCASRFNQCS